VGTFLLLSLLLPIISPHQNSPVPQQDSSISVLSFRWSKSRQVIEKLEPATIAPVAAVIPQNKNFERNRRAQAPAGTRDPNEDTVDGRSAAIEKSVQEARSPRGKPVDGFEYKAKIKNTGTKVIEVVFWEYRFIETADPSSIARRQFLCGVNIKPDKDKELQAFSLMGPSDVISVSSLANKSGNLFEEKIIINRVEYSDGTIWQRKGWNFGEVRLGIARAVGTPWGTEMCRGL
jgi:hypothetical protein